MSRTPRIFLCYRAGDDAYAAALLDDRLARAFGRDAVFRASRSILPGESYAEAIVQAIDRCSTVLAVIGPTWAGRIRDDAARGGDDWVRIEIAKALSGGARVIPLLLSRTVRLRAADLPPDIAPLAERQYLTFDHRNVERDIDQLLRVLRHADPALPRRRLVERLADRLTRSSPER